MARTRRAPGAATNRAGVPRPSGRRRTPLRGVYVADGDRNRRAGMRDGTTRKGRADRKNAAQFNAIPHS